MSEHGTITSLQHPLVKHLVKLRTDSAYRRAQQLLVFEGIKPIREISPLLSRLFYIPTLASEASAMPGEKWEVTEPVLKKISGTSSPEGMIAEMHMPPFVPLEKQRRVLGLDGISDPGNLGTLLRTALAFGWEAVYFLPGCCDPFNDKVLRSARGAHFKLALAKGSAAMLHHWVEKEHVHPLLADLNGKAPKEIKDAPMRLLVLGSEARGASDEVRNFCEPVSIPMSGNMESLNVAVAGGILLHLFS